MIISKTDISGAFLIRPERLEDERGFFARTFCAREFAAFGIDTSVVQRSVSFNRSQGTLRGMHFQIPPHAENKFVSCSSGAIYDVVVDIRPQSVTYRRWFGIVLSADTLDTVFVPAGCAHGFITTRDDTMVRYDMSEFYVPESSRGIRFDDPAFAIEWPFKPTVISPRDLAFPPYAP